MTKQATAVFAASNGNDRMQLLINKLSATAHRSAKSAAAPKNWRRRGAAGAGLYTEVSLPMLSVLRQPYGHSNVYGIGRDLALFLGEPKSILIAFPQNMTIF